MIDLGYISKQFTIMNKPVISIQEEIELLYDIFSRQIPNLNIDIATDTIKLHLKPYTEWRDSFLTKTISYKNSKIITKKHKEIIYNLLYVEYCSIAFNIVKFDNYDFLIELITMYPDSLLYKVNNINFSYYPIINLLTTYCYNKTFYSYPTIDTNILTPISIDGNYTVFTKIFYTMCNRKENIEEFLKLLNIMLNHKYEEPAKYPLNSIIFKACRVSRISTELFIFIKKHIDKQPQNVPYTGHMIDSNKILYNSFIWMEGKMKRFILKKKQHELYYGYYLLHLYLYKDCEASFYTNLGELLNFVDNHNIGIFKYAQFWEWIFEIIMRFQLKFPKEFKRTKNETVRIHELYRVLQKYCNEKYIIYSYYDTSLAWLLCYNNNHSLIRELYDDLANNTEIYNYEKICLDIVHYGNYELVINSWYYVSQELRYFKNIPYCYYNQSYSFSNDNAFTLSILNKDKRVFKFICEHFSIDEININIICKTIHNLFTFYAICYNKWKKNTLLNECKYKLKLLIDNFYFKDIWIGFLMGYYLFSISYTVEQKHILYLFKWFMQQCIDIESGHRNIKGTISSVDFDNYYWLNDFEFQTSCQFYINEKCQDLINEYMYVICCKNLTASELYDYKDCIVYLFINNIYKHIVKEDGDMPNCIEEKMMDVLVIYTDNDDYILSILSKIISIYKDYSNTPIKSIKLDIFKRIISYLFDFFKKYKYTKKQQVFYIIRNKGLLESNDVLDWCIRNGMEFHNKSYWKLLKQWYSTNDNYTNSAYYKWERVAQIINKCMFRFRMKRSNISKQILHIELITNYAMKNLSLHASITENMIMYNQNHPVHITKSDTLKLLQDATWVSPKIDGIRKLLYVEDLEDKHPKLLNQIKQILKEYYFIADKILYKNRYIYIIHEVWDKYKNKELTAFEMELFYNSLKIQMNMFNRENLEVLLNNHIIETNIDKYTGVDINTKDIWLFKPFYYALPHLDGLSRWNYIYKQYQFIPIDGLIIKNRNNEKFKLKPIQQLSIDLKIKCGTGIDMNNNVYPISISKFTNQIDYDIKSITLEMIENEIVQCVFNPTTKIWNIQRIRHDKKYPNTREIIEKIEDIYNNPFWIDDLFICYI